MQTCPRPSRAFSRLVLVALALVLPVGPGRRGQAALLPQFTTIQAAIDAAADYDTITIPAGDYTESLLVTKPLTLAGASAGSTVIRAQNGKRVITVTITGGVDLTLRNLTLTGGSPPAGEHGGAVWVWNGSLVVEACILQDNQAVDGGAIYQAGTGSVTITNSTLHDNQASNRGGGIFAAGNVTLTEVSLSNNSAAWHGGGVHVDAGDLSISGGRMVQNQAGTSGGGAFVDNNLSIQDGTFAGNTAGNDGGAIMQWNGVNRLVTIANAHFEANQAVRYGGALSVAHGAETTIHGTRFIGNAVVGDAVHATNTAGGGVHFSGSVPNQSLTITGSIFQGNTAVCQNCDTVQGGGVFVSGSLGVSRSDFTGNKAAGHGGAIYAHPSSSTVTILTSKFDGNASTSSSGGALHLEASTAAHLENVVVMNTRVQSGSSVAFVRVPLITILHSTLTGTTTPSGRGDGISIDQAINLTNTAHVINTIIANQAAGVVVQSYAECSLDHTLWYGNTRDIDGAGTIQNLGPLYGDPAFAIDGYHLTSASPAIDRGTVSTVLFDIDQQGRGGQPDIGADEFYARVHIPLVQREPVNYDNEN